MGVIRTTLEGKASSWGMQGGSCPCHRWSSAEPPVGNPGLRLGAVYDRASAVLELWDFVPSSSCGGRSDRQAGTDSHVLCCWTPLRSGGAARGHSRARTASGNGRPAAAPGSCLHHRQVFRLLLSAGLGLAVPWESRVVRRCQFFCPCLVMRRSLCRAASRREGAYLF